LPNSRLFKGIVKGDAKVLDIGEFTKPRSIKFSVKEGFEDMFIKQIESYSWVVKKVK